MKSRKYVLVNPGNCGEDSIAYPATKLGLQHPSVTELHPDMEGVPILMYDRKELGTKPYYFIVPLRKGEFSEIRETEWDSVRKALENRYSGDFELIRKQWEGLENFDELLAKYDFTSSIPVESYRRTALLGSAPSEFRKGPLTKGGQKKPKTHRGKR
jgi:hypothetical protein